ncbi:MAG: hypothetical protein GY768_06485 [Planctomycetaceae bacterium]|nr:hypothetical protein [Planctomycetaceae bacterium]
MAAKRSQEGPVGIIGRLFRPLEGKAWFVAATLLGCTVLGIGSYHLWNQYGDTILHQSPYLLDPSKLSVNEQPEWIRSDVKKNAIAFGQLENASLLDQKLVLQVKQAFGVQPWVKRVNFVNKQFPSTVEVQVEYRRPIAMVEVPAGMFEDFDEPGLLPIDVDGCLLPVELTEQEAAIYPWISGINTSPAGPPGNPWGDDRVVKAASIIALLEDIWEPLKLHRIEVPTSESPADATAQLPKRFMLITRNRRQFDWGSAPGEEKRGEDTAADKAARLKKILEADKDLDSLELGETADLSEIIGIRYAKQPTLSR